MTPLGVELGKNVQDHWPPGSKGSSTQQLSSHMTPLSLCLVGWSNPKIHPGSRGGDRLCFLMGHWRGHSVRREYGMRGLVKATFGKPNLPQPPKTKNPKNCTEESVMYTEASEARPVRRSFFHWKKMGGAGKSKTSPGIKNMMERSKRIETTDIQRENLQVEIFSPALI